MEHELIGNSFHVFPININDLVVEVAELSDVSRPRRFVDDFLAWHDTAEGVRRGAFGHELRQNRRIDAAAQSQCRLAVTGRLFDTRSKKINQLVAVGNGRAFKSDVDVLARYAEIP